ncbi:MAG: hypothetical protein IKW04_01490 [Clostridia bacterium]|nr:hypothetical protein [Clostridia bacterium]
MKKLLAILLAAMMVFTVVGCDKNETPASGAPATDAPASDITGQYTLTDMAMSGEEVPLDGAPEMTLTVFADGTAKMYNGMATQDLTWTQSGDQISFVDVNGVADVFTIQGSQLVYDMNDIYMVFSK